MKTVLFFLFTLLVAACNITQEPILVLCDYTSDHKMVRSINNVLYESTDLALDPSFNFPYQLKGDAFPWEPGEVYNYKPLDTDIQTAFPDAIIELYIDNDGQLIFNIKGVAGGNFNEWHGDFNNDNVFILFDQTCY